MRIDELKNSLENARALIKEIEIVQPELDKAKENEKELMRKFLESIRLELKKISDKIPSLLEKEKPVSKKIELTNSERKKYLQDVGMDREMLKAVGKRIGKKKVEAEKIGEVYKKPGFFTKISSRLFSGISLKLVEKGMFKSINSSLRKANMPYLLSTYIAIALICSSISLIISIIIALMLTGIIGALAWLIVIVIPTIAFFLVLYYPTSEASSSKGKIDDELPFAIMHMSAIAGSGVEPTRVFSILAASHEYPTVRKEMRKLVNLINFYGYDLTSALKTTAKTTSNERLAELLNGMSTTISGGGDLRNYLDKIAEDSLLDYKLRRKRFTTISETYADIYTGLLIAAPLMFMLILVLMNVLGGGIGGMSSTTIALIGIGALIVLNIGFLVFLQVSQPSG